MISLSRRRATARENPRDHHQAGGANFLGVGRVWTTDLQAMTEILQTRQVKPPTTLPMLPIQYMQRASLSNYWIDHVFLTSLHPSPLLGGLASR